MTIKIVTAAVVIIGNEILSGRTQDTNINDIATAMTARGISLREVRIVADNHGEIRDGVREMARRYDYVVTTGGIGPTHDDITAAAIADAFDDELQLNEEAHRLLQEHYGDNLNEARLRMAHLPTKARLIDNPVSRAPGFYVDNVFVLAGVPVIMRAMLEHVMQLMAGGDVKRVVTLSFNIAEGELAQGLASLQERFADVEIGSYPWFKKASLGVHLVLRSYDETALYACAREVEQLAATKTLDES